MTSGEREKWLERTWKGQKRQHRRCQGCLWTFVHYPLMEVCSATATFFQYVDCFQLKRALEPPKWDLCCRASSVCVCALGRIKAHSTVLISDTDYDFYERLRHRQIQYQCCCCIQDLLTFFIHGFSKVFLLPHSSKKLKNPQASFSTKHLDVPTTGEE